ncbi:MAG: (Fe-S)-binding protein [Solirubrobacteraceae bacterium]
MNQPLFVVAFVVALAAFARALAPRARLLARAQPVARFDRLGARARRMALDGLGQRKFLAGEQPSGIIHALIFWGFLVLLAQLITQFGRAFDANWHIPGFGPDQLLGPPFFLVRDLLETTVIVAVLYMLYRRLIAHTPRLFGLGKAEARYREAPHWEGILILVLILLIMAGGLLADAGRLVAYNIHGNERAFAPLTGLVADALGGLRPSRALTVSEVGWWLHNLTVLLFLNLLPRSKHFHIITGLPNVFFGKLAPASVPLVGVDSGAAASRVLAAPAAQLEPPAKGRVAVVAVGDLSWKQVLDAFSCTECGRCSAACPATAAGAPLAPRQLILDIRERLYRRPERQRGGDDGTAVDAADRAGLISDEVLWSCTTCMACSEACPVGIEHVPTIVDMRRGLVDQGRIEPLLQEALENLAKHGNSYGKSVRMRARWTKGLEFTIPDARKEKVSYLWFVGDFASFDERAQAASRRLAAILHDAGVSFGLLYDGERNAGNDVRRIGEEGLFEMLVEHNMAAFAGAQFDAIFTADPHSLNTLRNEYPLYGLRQPVYHYTELLSKLVSDGSIVLGAPLQDARVTYHDPCYLARYNRITAAPRALIEATGAQLVEMPRCGTDTFCCGAGGGRIWMDDSALSERPSEQRIREAQALGGVQRFVVSCPKDLAMYTDAANTLGAEFEVTELTALLAAGMGAR